MIANPLWSPQDVADLTLGELQGTPSERLTGVSIDTRTIAPHEIFFAIQGDRFDGHTFVDRAIAAGAGLNVVERQKLDLVPQDGPYLLVDDAMVALRRLAEGARVRSSAKRVAITGSVGKTSTKEALRTVLTPSGQVHAANASFNNHWGVPLTLARLPQSADYGVFEIGMNHAGEITPLTQLVRPHVAIVTTVAAAHLENFESIEGIAYAKAEIFKGVTDGGAALINADIDHTELLIEAAEACGISRIFTFGESALADVVLKRVQLLPDCSTVSARIFDQDIVYKIGAPGRHLVQNSLAVLAAAVLVGADLARAGLAFQSVAAEKGRGARHTLSFADGGTATLIDESYNANPTSVKAALELLAAAVPTGQGRRIAVLGDMLELGEDEAELHAALLDPIQKANVDLVYLVGPRMAALWEALPKALRGGYRTDAKDIISPINEALMGGDVVLVKSSNGIKTGKVVEFLIDRYTPESV